MSAIDRTRARWFLRNVLPHEPALRRWLVRNPVQGVDPDDVIQESYAIFAELPAVDGIINPRAYLFQIARSLIARHVRRTKIVSISALGDLQRLDPPDDAATPEQQAISRDELGRLAEAIAAMPKKTREAFILRRVKGLSQREIASEMGISESTVEKHISRGTRFLVEWFANSGTALPRDSKNGQQEFASLDGQARSESRH